MVRADDIAAAVAALRAGEVIGLPTETVYGLAGDAANPAAIARIYAIKGRPATHPVIVHIADAEAMTRWARHVPVAARALADAFWPGPLTLVLPKQPWVLDEVTGGQDTVALRVPAHPVARQVLAAFGGGLAAPSANRYGRVSPTTATHVRDDLGEAVPIVLDGGPSAVGLESTIVACLDDEVRILRPGHITTPGIAAIVGAVATRRSDEPRVPGSVHSHYAPRTPVELLPTSAIDARVAAHAAGGRLAAVLSPRAPTSPDVALWVETPDDPAAYGQALYANLRALDRARAQVILVAAPPDEPAWAAVRDRLTRAAARPDHGSIP